jgi:DNA topoisomerase-2
MKEFFAVRIRFYEKRKVSLLSGFEESALTDIQQWQLAEMQKDLEKLSNQARFIQMIIDGKLVVSKKKKKDLVAELKQKNFKPFRRSPTP